MDTTNELKQLTDKPVYFRKHPQARERTDLISIDGELQQTLNRCAGVITYNSNSGVDALIAGVPTMASDIGSMAWPVASKSLEQLLEFNYPDRMQWLNNLAYTQWTIDEVMDGSAWKHLWRRVDALDT